MDASSYSVADRRCFPWASSVDFSQAVVTNAELVFTAGQGPFGPDGAIVAIDDPVGQIRQAFQNLSTVLESSGASLETVVNQTVYLSRAEDFPAFKEVRAELYSTPFPTTTTLRVDLLEPGMLVEISAVAAVGAPRTEKE